MIERIYSRYKNLEFYRKNGRIDAFDLYRFIAIFLMIEGHTIYEFAAPGYIDYNVWYWNLWTFIRGLTAPIFMLISGTVNVFATKRLPNGKVDPAKFKKRIRTAVNLLFIAYFLAFPSTSLRFLDKFDMNFWLAFWQTNILHITAICLLLLQIIFYFTRNDKQLMISALCFGLFANIIAWFMQQTDWYQILPTFLAPYLSYKNGAIYTLFPVSAYFFYGVTIGAYVHSRKKEDLFKTVFIKSTRLGIVLMAIGIPMFNLLNTFPGPTWCQICIINPFAVVMRLGIVMTAFPLVVILTGKLKKISWLFLTLSRKSLFLFVTHIIVIYGCAIFPGLNAIWSGKLTGLPLILSACLVEVVSMSIAYWYDKTMKAIPSIKYAYASVIAMIILMINIIF